LSFYPYHLLVFFFFYSYHPPRFLHSFPTRRSSDLSTASAARIFPLSACFTVAISSLPRHRIPPSCGGTLLFYSRVGGHASLPSRSEEHTSELQSRSDLVCRLLLEKKNKYNNIYNTA